MTPARALRLLFVIDRLSSGGGQRQLLALAGELARRGHRIDVYAWRPDPFEAQHPSRPGVTIVGGRTEARYSPAPLLGLARQLRAEPYDAVLSFLPIANLYSLLVARGLRLRVPVVVSERSARRTEGERLMTQRVAERAYRLADAITVNSHHRRRAFRDHVPAVASRVRTIWNGVDLEAFPATPPPARRGPPKLLALGTLGPSKNAGLLVEAFAALAAEGLRPTVTWVVRRSSQPRPGEARVRRELEERLARGGLEAQWRWQDEGVDVAAMLREHDALVHPSLVEGLPNAVCEALACGRPVLASDVLDHPQLVADGERGFLFDPWDAASLAGAIRRLDEADDAARAAIGRAGRAFAERELSLDRLGDRYEKLFLELGEGA